MTSTNLAPGVWASAPWRRLWTGLTADAAHGPLPALLLGLTVLTGLVDAVSILALGRVFVANMTGNVVFVGFGLAGSAGFSVLASLAGLAGFIVGARSGGWLSRALGHDRARLLAAGSSVELALLAASTVLVTLSAPTAPLTRYTAVAVLAVATGTQNAVARRLGVPDLTTTVLTMTLTGIAADVRAGRPSLALGRRLLAVASMLTGAVGGAALVLHAGATAALGLATILVGTVTVATWHTTRHPAAWRMTDAAVADGLAAVAAVS